MAKVQALNRKESGDAEGQVIEDALCLVFVEFQLADFARRNGSEKAVTALRKSWQKMSAEARNLAETLQIGESERRVLRSALEQ